MKNMKNHNEYIGTQINQLVNNLDTKGQLPLPVVDLLVNSIYHPVHKASRSYTNTVITRVLLSIRSTTYNKNYRIYNKNSVKLIK